VRGGSATRGFPPGSAQALVALVLGLTAAVVGVRRGDHLLALVFLAVAVVGGIGLARLLRRRRP
jgi:Flp pilus assembly protein TadB